MARFTQYTQAATCVCHGRGYVVKDDFEACAYCPAGAEFAKKRQAAQVVATLEAPELAPVIAGPAKPVRIRTRKSAEFPNITLEIAGSVLTFRVGLGFISYDISTGQLRLVDAMDGGYILPAERQHIAATAQAYARKAVA